MKPTGEPFVKGPSSNPPTHEEILALIEQNEGGVKENLLGDDFVAIVIFSIILILLILWNKKFWKN